MNTNRWKNYGLWVSIAALIPLLLSAFGINIIPEYQEIVNSVLGVLVLAGIINNPSTHSKGYLDDTSNTTPTQDTKNQATDDTSKK